MIKIHSLFSDLEIDNSDLSNYRSSIPLFHSKTNIDKDKINILINAIEKYFSLLEKDKVDKKTLQNAIDSLNDLKKIF